jgi:hypothetical protein
MQEISSVSSAFSFALRSSRLLWSGAMFLTI